MAFLLSQIFSIFPSATTRPIGSFKSICHIPPDTSTVECLYISVSSLVSGSYSHNPSIGLFIEHETNNLLPSSVNVHGCIDPSPYS